MLTNLKERNIAAKEELDDLTLNSKKVGEAMRGLKTINQLLGNKKSVLNEVSKTFNATTASELVIVDLGCGGGDLLRELEKLGRKMSKNLTLIGIDGNPNVVHFASKERSNIKFMVADILSDEFRVPPCDILISSHFIYRFTDQQLTSFIMKTAPFVRCKIIISELQRSTLAYHLFNLLTSIIPTSSIVKHDGLLAIKKSFKRKELDSIIGASGSDYNIHWKWIFRYLVAIKTN